MKKNEVKVGGIYKAKVSNNLVSVKITSENPSGGWSALNTNTGKTVRIKSAQRLRGPANQPAKRKKIVSLAQYEAEAKAELAATGTTPPKEPSKDTTAKEKRDTGQPAAKGTKPAGQPSTHPGENGKPLSLIKAAVCVLEACERPLNCKEIVTKAMDAKIWAPRNGGLTPANTLSAAIRKEIKTKDNASRFTQVERGKFVLASKV